MSAPPLFTVGTPQGQWATRVPALLGPAVGAGTGAPAAVVDPSELDALVQQSPAAQYLVFVENPAVGLAAALAAGLTADPTQWLDEWRAGAQRLLRHAQRGPARCLLVDAGEALCQPQALADACVSRFGVQLGVEASLPPAPATDALSRALADALAFADQEVQALFTELQASCALLSADEPALTTTGLGLKIDGAAAVQRLYQLQAAQQAAAQAAVELPALRAQADGQAAALQQQAGQLVVALAERDDQARAAASAQRAERQLAAELHERRAEADNALRSMREVSDRLRAQLCQVQEERDSAVLARREAGEAAVRTAVELEQSAAQIALLQAHLVAATDQRDEQARLAEAAAEARRQAAADLEARLGEAGRNLKSANEESELLLLQLHKVQEELERVVLARRETEDRLARASATAQEAGAQVAALQGQLAAANTERETQARTAEAAAAAQRKTAADLQAKVAQAGRDLQAAREEGTRLQLQVKQAQAELESLRQARREADERLARAVAGAEQSAAQIATLRAQQDKAALDATQRGSELDAARRDLESARQEGERLLLQLRQVQEELEMVVLARRETEDRLARASATAQEAGAQVAALQGQLAAANTERDTQARSAEAAVAAQRKTAADLQAKVAQAGRDLQAAREEGTRLQQQLNKAALDATQRGSELDAARRDLESARQGGELLLLQLHQVQEELENYYLQCRDLEATVAEVTAAAAAAPSFGLPGLAIGELLLVAERDTPPHRELTFEVRQVKAGAREVAEATVRLVEHCGHPGLVVFGNPQGEQLLESWRETGREDDRPFALLIPNDANTQPLLAAMGSADWLLAQAVVARLENQLAQASAPWASHWRQLARRLHEQMQEMPRRFRYGALDIEPAPGAAAGTLAFRFGQVHCGARYLERLVLHWQPAGPLAGLALLADADAGPPLLSWPADALLPAPERLWLPLGAGVSSEAKRGPWARLAPADLDFVLALLAQWPAVVARIPQAVLGTEPGAQALTAAAAALLDDARRAAAPTLDVALAPGGLLRRVARRLRQSTAAA